MGNIVLDARFTSQQIARLKDMYPELAEDADLLAGMVSGETQYERVLGKIVDEYLDAVSMRAAIKERQAALRERADRFERKADAMKTLAIALMGAAGDAMARLPEATLSVRAGKPSVVVDDVDDLPQGMFRLERVAIKAAIAAAFEAGEHVPGAHVEPAQPILSVRTN